MQCIINAASHDSSFRENNRTVFPWSLHGDKKNIILNPRLSALMLEQLHLSNKKVRPVFTPNS